MLVSVRSRAAQVAFGLFTVCMRFARAGAPTKATANEFARPI
ncbi:MAG TPA: hypothetical protein VH475_26180 [Tepidisphaeraceae bacterium]